MKHLYSLIFALVLLVLCLTAAQKPFYNWDMLGYMGVIFEYKSLSPEEVHKEVYTSLKNELSPAHFDRLTSMTESRANRYQDSNAFHEIIKFYRVKPLFVSIVYVIHKMGVPLTRATTIPAILGYFLFGCLLFYWLGKEISNKAIVLGVSILSMLFLPLIAITKFSSPDTLSCFLILAASFLYFYNKKLIWIALFSLLVVLARIDNLAYITLLLLAIYYEKNGISLNEMLKNPWLSLKSIFVIGISCLFLFILVSLGLGNSIDWMSNYIYFASFEKYLYSLLEVPKEVLHSYLPILLCFAIAAWPFLSKKTLALILISLGAIIGKTILFPHFEERYIVPQELIILISIIIAISTPAKQVNLENGYTLKG